MKYIPYIAEFTTAGGFPMFIQDPDPRIQIEARDKARAEKKERYDAPTIQADFAQVVAFFLNGMPWKKNENDKLAWQLTPEDAGNAYAVIKAFKGHENGYVVLEDAAYKWFCDKLALDGPTAFGITQAVVVERLESALKELPKEVEAATEK